MQDFADLISLGRRKSSTIFISCTKVNTCTKFTHCYYKHHCFTFGGRLQLPYGKWRYCSANAFYYCMWIVMHDLWTWSTHRGQARTNNYFNVTISFMVSNRFCRLPWLILHPVFLIYCVYCLLSVTYCQVRHQIF